MSSSYSTEAQFQNEGIITLESFANPSHKWIAKNDPVMGGESHATVDIQNGLGIFDGEVVDVPFLQAPGFVTMQSTGGSNYPDVSLCHSLRLVLRTPEMYSGYRVSFGNRHVPGNRFAFGYKANFDPPVMDITGEMSVIDIPFHNFTVRWDDATGDPIVTCEENNDFCPDEKTLKNMKTISIWGEGVGGKVHLEIASIEAIGCGSSDTMNMNMLGAVNTHSGGFTFAPVIAIVLLFSAFSFAVSQKAFFKRNRTTGYEDVNSNNVNQV